MWHGKNLGICWALLCVALSGLGSSLLQGSGLGEARREALAGSRAALAEQFRTRR